MHDDPGFTDLNRQLTTLQRLTQHQREVFDQVRGRYVTYILVHIFWGWFLALKASWRATRRRYGRIFWRRLLVNDLPLIDGACEVVYACGLGELRTAAKFAQVLTEKRQIQVVILCETDDLLDQDYADVAIYPAPFNNPVCVLRAIRKLRPTAIWIVENFHNHHFKALAAWIGIPTVIFNTQDSVLSEVKKRGAKWRIPLVGLYATQSEHQRDALCGSLVAPEYVQVTGPVAMGLPKSAEPSTDRPTRLAELLRPEPGQYPVILAGSVYPEDAEILLAAFKSLLSEVPNARLILAPRHLTDVSAIYDLASKSGLKATRRSKNLPCPDAHVVLLDSIGELRQAYETADIAFVGGTFGAHRGGHTPLEAFAANVPVTFGPHFPNQTEIVNRLCGADLAWMASNGEELANLWLSLAKNSNLRNEMQNKVSLLKEEFDLETVDFYDRILERYSGTNG